jgi:hypothetical protein
MDSAPLLGKVFDKRDASKAQSDLLLLAAEIASDKLDIIREPTFNREHVKEKIEALGWHGRCLGLIGVTQVQEAITLFKRALIPSDNPEIRNTYIKMTDHRSVAVTQLSSIIKNESLNEKMTLTQPRVSAEKDLDGMVDNSVV